MKDVKPDVKSIFIIGNAFGYSTIFLSLLFQEAKVVAMDAGIEGEDNMLGISLTQSIIKKHRLNAAVEFAFSPKDNHSVVSKHFSTPIDLVFIDGLHTNEQLLLDFQGMQNYCDENTIWVMHDVINWHMQNAFAWIANCLSSTHISRILYRTQSGMGLAVPQHDQNAIELLEAFSEDDKIITDLIKTGRYYDRKYLRMLKRYTPNFIKKGIKKCLKKP